MWQEFKAFLTKTNALALAVGVVIGAAVGKVVTAIVYDVVMPVVGLVLPKGDWRQAMIVFGEAPDPTDSTKQVPYGIRYGDLIGNLVDFFVVAFIVFMIVKALLREKPKAPPPLMKDCPFCLMSIPKGATKCQACTSALPA